MSKRLWTQLDNMDRHYQTNVVIIYGDLVNIMLNNAQGTGGGSAGGGGVVGGTGGGGGDGAHDSKIIVNPSERRFPFFCL